MPGSSHVRFQWTNRAVRPQIRPLNEPYRRGHPWWTAPALIGVFGAIVAIGVAAYIWGTSGIVLVANSGPLTAAATPPVTAVPAALAQPQPTLAESTATPTPQPPVNDDILLSRAAAEQSAPVVNWPILVVSASRVSSASQITPIASAESDAVYVVRAGDTFVGIAESLGVDDGELARLNDVTNRDRLTIGQELRVPAKAGTQPATLAKPAANSAAVFRPQFVWPSIGPITTDFGEAGAVWIGGSHMGLDIAAPPGDAILAAEAGKVLEAGWSTSRGYGNYIVIDHGMGYRTLYGHLSVIRIREGQQVKRGQLVGDVGSTGVSSGPHLHFEIQDWGKPVDPILYIGPKPPTDRVKLPKMLTAY